MSDTFTSVYAGEELVLRGCRLPCGSLAMLALNLSRDVVSELERLYRKREDEVNAASMRGALNGLDFISGASEGEIADCAGAVDDIICFRVYLRRVLSAAPFKSSAEDYAHFISEINNLSSQLRNEHNLRRTVLSTSLTPCVGFSTEGGSLCERFSFGSVRELLLFDLFRAMVNARTPRACRCCGIYFVPSRSGEIYCTGTAPGGEGRTCREIGARRRFAEKLSSNEILRLYRSACGRVYTRKSRGGITTEEAAEMTALCTKLRDQALEGEITVDQLGEQLIRATRKR